MYKKPLLIGLAVVLLLGGVYAVRTWMAEDMVVLDQPLANAVISSPLKVSGKARGTWFFEGSFPIVLTDADGRVLAQVPAQAMDEWMTTDWVPFEATLTFTVPAGTTQGTLTLQKDNPSDLAEHDDSRQIPILFAAPQRTVKLFFYDPARDRDAAGNVLCSAKGLVAVNRSIDRTNTPIQDAVRLLLTEHPTGVEANTGLVSEFPLAGVQLTGAASANGVLTLAFADPDHRTGGGSCFVSILRAQVEATAKQFGGVVQVRLTPEDLFQP